MFGAKIMRRAALETEIISESMKDFSLISNEIITKKILPTRTFVN